MNELSRLTCQELVELVTDYLEGTLPEAARRSFEAHLSDCHNCDGPPSNKNSSNCSAAGSTSTTTTPSLTSALSFI